MSKIKDKLGNLGIVISMIVGYLVAFFMYLNCYLDKNTSIHNQIKGLLSDMSIAPERETAFLVLLSGICSIVIFIVAVVIYKIIFRITKVNVDEKKLLFAIALAYIFDFFVCYFALHYFSNMILILLLGNIIEMIVVFCLCFDKVKINLFKAIALRILLLVGNCICVLLK